MFVSFKVLRAQNDISKPRSSGELLGKERDLMQVQVQEPLSSIIKGWPLTAEAYIYQINKESHSP